MNVDQATLKELRAIRGLLEGIADKLGVSPKPKAKPWASVASVTRNHLTREVTANDPAVPSALTPEMRREAEAQTVEPSNPKHIETFEPIRLSEENLKRGGWQR